MSGRELQQPTIQLVVDSSVTIATATPKTPRVSRPTLFKKSMRKFNIAWWAYSFPLTMLALAAAEYAQEVKGHAAAALMLMISGLSLLVFIGLLLFTVFNVAKLLCENDPILSFAKDPMA